MTTRQIQVLQSFFLGLVLVEIPVISTALLSPSFDWKILLAGLLGGLSSALIKYQQTNPETIVALHTEAVDKVVSGNNNS